MFVALPTIPWTHSRTEFGSVWQWKTPHFEITVTGDNLSCYWKIVDLSEGRERVFGDGRTTTFEQSERQVRETIGKGYDPKFGYQVFAGSLATTFMISTGDMVDLGPFNGQPVEVTAITREGGVGVFTGIGMVQNYDFTVVRDGKAVLIRPTYIVSVTSPRATMMAPKSGNRNISGSVIPGCTGRPGFLSGTVDHTELTCPIHEES